MLRRMLCFMAIVILKLRYKITIEGLDNIKTKAKEGGILFLPNHPSMMDPVVLFVHLFASFQPSPLVADTFFDIPLIGYILKKVVRAKSIVDLDLGGNDFTKMLAIKSLDDIAKDLDLGKNFIIYPSGKLKRSALEEVGAASGVFQIIQESKKLSVVLIRTTGFWGSSFSRAQLGTTPDLLKAFAHGFKVILANGIFFTPKRSILIEMEVIEKDIHSFKNKLELNEYLDKWYNLPFSQSGEPLRLVREYFWSRKKPGRQLIKKEKIDLSNISETQKKIVIEEIARLAKKSTEEVSLSSNLARDLGFDSLDLVEIIAFLDDKYEVKNVYPQDLIDVSDVVACIGKKNVTTQDFCCHSVWKKEKRSNPLFPEGNTIIDVFLASCKLRGSQSALFDEITGVISYNQLLITTLLLAEKIKKLKGDNIGILMPASAASFMLVIATFFAKKKPVMLNWTLGSKNLQEVIEISNVQSIISSSKFLQQARVMDLRGVDENLFYLEKIKKEIGVIDFIKAYFFSKKSPESIKKIFCLGELLKEDIAVYLFTSGTESKPKAVPLTHENLLSNLRDASSIVTFDKEDVLYCFLPSFHSFGFSTTSLFPVLAGIRVAFSADPTDSVKLAKGLKRYAITVLCAAPTFLIPLLRYADKESLKKLKYVISGAEKAPRTLFETVENETRAQLLEGYGITECSPILTLNRPNEKSRGVGKVLPHVELLIVDLVHFQPLDKGKEGLILVRGPNIFSGYLQKDIKSTFIEVGGKLWYNTADLGFLTDDDHLILSGRLKRFVKMGGEMINLVSLEEAIAKIIQIENIESVKGPLFAIIALEKEGQRPILTLFTPLVLDHSTINAALKEQGFSSIVKINEIKKLDALPLLGSGKINYRALELI
jgi:acyl-CoA synthetase (AMP-forming)/AMP-acid ligase II/1-acyl-sn-glycerol-3-phosphate acyltransferase/acyl carrier protein